MMKEHSHKATLLLLAGLLLIFGTGITAQAQFRVAPVTKIGNKLVCHLAGESKTLTPNTWLIYGLGFNGKYRETQEIFDKVSGYTKLTSNIYTVPVLEDINVEICPGNVNYIVYNADWLKAVYDETNSLWALYAIIAHEIGHYVKAHDRTEVGSKPPIELEADEYAGETLAKMGACLSDAQTAYRSKIMRNDQGSHTHPPTDQRLAAVKRGWERFGKICPSSWGELIQRDPSRTAPTQVDLTQAPMTITISGQGNTIYIVSGSSSANTGPLLISGQNNTETFYLENGRIAQVTVSGQLNKIYVSSELRDRVRVVKSGQLNEVIIK